MRLYLEFIEGPRAGSKLSLESRTSLGRAQGDIVINDPKLSGLHVVFDYEEGVGWHLIDSQSRNGVWLNGHRELRALLKSGDIIQVGSSQIRCRFLRQDQQKSSEGFQGWVQSLVKKLKNGKSPVSEIKPEMRLRVIQGIQYGEVWDIFYGPRQAGRESLDICLYEDKAPKDSFQIQVKGKYAYFSTAHEKIVMLNNQNVTSKQFAPGDIITIGESKILVEFDEGHGFSS